MTTAIVLRSEHLRLRKRWLRRRSKIIKDYERWVNEQLQRIAKELHENYEVDFGDYTCDDEHREETEALLAAVLRTFGGKNGLEIGPITRYYNELVTTGCLQCLIRRGSVEVRETSSEKYYRLSS